MILTGKDIENVMIVEVKVLQISCTPDNLKGYILPSIIRIFQMSTELYTENKPVYT